LTDLIQVKVPDIGDADGADIIEILVAVGDKIEKETALIVLETDKATMEVPSSHAGVIKNLAVKVGDQVSTDSLILELEAVNSDSNSDADKPVAAPPIETPPTETSSIQVVKNNEVKEVSEAVTESEQSSANMRAETIDITVPDIGDAAEVDVIEVLINQGDKIEKEHGLVVLETDKATMEVPSSDSGTVLEVLVKVGDKVSQGDVIGTLTIEASLNSAVTPSTEVSVAKGPAEPSHVAESSSVVETTETDRAAPVPDHPHMKKKKSDSVIHASPSVRRFARELGADLSKIKGTGNKLRIVKDDVQNFIKFELSRPKANAASGSTAMPQMPKVDHAKWGKIESQALTRIQKISSVNLHRNWVTIPHVTQHEDADITELDAFRKAMKEEAMQAGTRLTPLAFIMKGLVHTLKAFPKFNSSLDNDGESLVVKHYYHIGVAVETPDGLTVPVIRDVDQKGIYQLADELGAISAKAREKKLGVNDMQGSSFTISSLGGIGGTAFSPIVKWPDVAILGLSRNKMQPVWNGKEFVPRLMLPMSLSYDHRVIDGADAARFVVHLAATLKDIRRVLLN